MVIFLYNLYIFVFMVIFNVIYTFLFEYITADKLTDLSITKGCGVFREYKVYGQNMALYF